MLALIALLGPAAAQEPVPVEVPAVVEPDPAVDPAVIHDALRDVRARLLAALKAEDVESLLQTLHPDIVMTTTSGEVVRGHEGVRKYVARMLDGPDAVVESFVFDASSDELSLLYGGDAAIAWGPSADHYVFTNGETVDLDTRWSATLVRQPDGSWVVASFHSSLGAFDNALVDGLAAMMPKVALGAGVVGLLLGVGVGVYLGRLSRKAG